ARFAVASGIVRAQAGFSCFGFGFGLWSGGVAEVGVVGIRQGILSYIYEMKIKSKAEPSPTTGSFRMPQATYGSSGLNMFTSGTSSSNALVGSKSNFFEFKPQFGSNFVSGLTIEGSSALADTNHNPSEQAVLLQSDQSHTVASPAAASVTASVEVAAPSGELGPSASVHMVTSNGFIPAEAHSCISAQRDHGNSEVQLVESEHKVTDSSAMNERTSEDGYNWRKYGQKLVKGSEYPRSYYKCTHPNCEVKKLFERSPDGEITEVIYKGRHDHPKPLPSRRISAGAMMPIQEDRVEKFSSIGCQEDNLTTFAGHLAQNDESSTNHELSPRAADDTSVEGGVSQSNRINDDVIDADDDPFSKRRRMEAGLPDISSVIKPIREPRVVVQTLSEVDILDDGYRWRKYGQKVVRGNPNPRSYYKCTSAGCSVRKHVERASHDPKAVITTYEGIHNHEVPTAKTCSHDTAIASSGVLKSRVMPRDGEAVSLNLRVGSHSDADNYKRQQHAESIPGQTNISRSNFLSMHGTPIGTFPGYVNGAVMLYGSNSSIGNQRLNHPSNPYQQTMGRVSMRP
ncbi:putative WRKY transcription factor 20, partial [Drosera capensis]